MNKTYNLYNIEAKFAVYLTSKKYGAVTIKNYVSDLHQTLIWLGSLMEIDTLGQQDNIEMSFMGLMTVTALDAYFCDLREKHIPEKSINRKMSSLGLFASFCIDQQWISDNPIKELRKMYALKLQDNPLSALSQFKSALENEKVSAVTVKNYLADIREFITITSSHP